MISIHYKLEIHVNFHLNREKNTLKSENLNTWRKRNILQNLIRSNLMFFKIFQKYITLFIVYNHLKLEVKTPYTVTNNRAMDITNTVHVHRGLRPQAPDAFELKVEPTGSPVLLVNIFESG